VFFRSRRRTICVGMFTPRTILTYGRADHLFFFNAAFNSHFIRKEYFVSTKCAHSCHLINENAHEPEIVTEWQAIYERTSNDAFSDDWLRIRGHDVVAAGKDSHRIATLEACRLPIHEPGLDVITREWPKLCTL
jgi:hypothetical protein